MYMYMFMYDMFMYMYMNSSGRVTGKNVFKGDIPSITKHHSFELLPLGVNIVVAITLCALYHTIAYILLKTMPPIVERR